MNNTRLQYLFEKYFNKTASVEERAELADLMGMENHREEVMQLFAAAWEKYEGEGMIIPFERSEDLLDSILDMPAPSISVEREEVQRMTAGAEQIRLTAGADDTRQMAGTEDTRQMTGTDEFRQVPGGEGTEREPRRQTGVKMTGVRKIPAWARVAAAAVLLIAGIFLYRSVAHHKAGNNQMSVVRVAASDVKPGTHKASLTLADGRQIPLDSAGPGQLAVQGDTKIISGNGGLLYQQQGNKTGPVLYNTLSTGRGETYSFVLSDGSRIWLNSASSIRFPVVFPGRERRIEVSGEVYIEVAKNVSKTFVVRSGGLETEALGTAFNIMAYPDEDHISATLVEGAVRVKAISGEAIPEKGKAGEASSMNEASGNVPWKGAASGGVPSMRAKPGEASSVNASSGATILRPGQQAKLNGRGELSQPENVDIDGVVAWKEGNFQFEDADIRTILRQFSRWYDVEVIYEGPIKNRKYFGLISRNSTLANVLEMLKASDISFRIEGKKLYVRPG